MSVSNVLFVLFLSLVSFSSFANEQGEESEIENLLFAEEARFLESVLEHNRRLEEGYEDRLSSLSSPDEERVRENVKIADALLVGNGLSIKHLNVNFSTAEVVSVRGGFVVILAGGAVTASGTIAMIADNLSAYKVKNPRALALFTAGGGIAIVTGILAFGVGVASMSDKLEEKDFFLLKSGTTLVVNYHTICNKFKKNKINPKNLTCTE